MANEPIDPGDYLHGLKVVDIGDLRVARGKTRRPFSACAHKNLSYDAQERRIFCRDCETDVDPFDAFIGLCGIWDSATKQLKAKQQQVEEARNHEILSLAAKEIDKAWRRKRMVPACPSCGEGLLPEDFKSGIKSSVSAEWARAKRSKVDK